MTTTTTREQPPAAELLAQWNDYVGNLVDRWTELWRFPPTSHERGCSCGSTTRCPDRCDCCVGDADIVIETHAGEVRVVPITVTNDTRRSTEIHFEAGEFTVACGDAQGHVEARITPATLPLGPCEDGTALLHLAVRAARGDAPTAATRKRVEEAHVADIEACEVHYGDIRLGGCDRRPLRVAVAVRPHECGAVPVECSCGCC